MKRSINSLLDYTIKGTDGEIGKVEEFYFDDQTSTIRYMVVKPEDGLPKKSFDFA
jgi:sporulation protein YlmC with PRC-barrel domain